MSFFRGSTASGDTAFKPPSTSTRTTSDSPKRPGATDVILPKWHPPVFQGDADLSSDEFLHVHGYLR